jgi:hypothetical protein
MIYSSDLIYIVGDRWRYSWKESTWSNIIVWSGFGGS